jgi:hypothetical protein
MNRPREAREETLSQGGGAQLLLAAGGERSGLKRAEPMLRAASSSVLRSDELDADRGGAGDERGAAAPAPALPCLFVTTASKEEKEEDKGPLPGPRKKQADALTENIKWMAKTFGPERIGFLTLTLGDLDVGGRYRNLRDHKKAQRRLHSLLTNVIAKRYQCGVIVTERHTNQGIHFHLAVVCLADICGNMDFNACFPPKDGRGKPMYPPDYLTANDAIKREWAFLRRICKRYGFGRHQLQPMRENAEALGRYLGEYLSKDWNNRLPEDKGARCVRYFGHWSKTPRIEGERRKAPPHNGRFGWMTSRARAWRELVKQAMIVLNYKGAKMNEQNIKDIIGPKWAWKMGRLFEAVRFETGDWQDAELQKAIEEHNFKVHARWTTGGGDPARTCWWHVTEITLDHLRPSPEWKKQMAELQLVKECEAEIRKGLKVLAKRKWQEAEQRRMVGEVADLFQAEQAAA